MPDEPSEKRSCVGEAQGTGEASPHNTVITVGRGEDDDTEEEDGVKPLPDRQNAISELHHHTPVQPGAQRRSLLRVAGLRSQHAGLQLEHGDGRDVKRGRVRNRYAQAATRASALPRLILRRLGNNIGVQHEHQDRSADRDLMSARGGSKSISSPPEHGQCLGERLPASGKASIFVDRHQYMGRTTAVGNEDRPFACGFWRGWCPD